MAISDAAAQAADFEKFCARRGYPPFDGKFRKTLLRVFISTGGERASDDQAEGPQTLTRCLESLVDYTIPLVYAQNPARKMPDIGAMLYPVLRHVAYSAEYTDGMIRLFDRLAGLASPFHQSSSVSVSDIKNAVRATARLITEGDKREVHTPRNTGDIDAVCSAMRERRGFLKYIERSAEDDACINLIRNIRSACTIEQLYAQCGYTGSSVGGHNH